MQESGWHKWEWVSGLELVWMMLDYYDHTQDAEFLKKHLLPTAHEILTFFDQHYATGADGKLVMHPAQALETWWKCTNPMPELAGLHAVSKRLLELPAGMTPENERAFWTALRAKLPVLPTREIDGQLALAPASQFRRRRATSKTRNSTPSFHFVSWRSKRTTSRWDAWHSTNAPIAGTSDGGKTTCSWPTWVWLTKPASTLSAEPATTMSGRVSRPSGDRITIGCRIRTTVASC